MTNNKSENLIEERLLRYIPKYTLSVLNIARKVDNGYELVLKDGWYFDSNKSNNVIAKNVRQFNKEISNYSSASVPGYMWGNYTKESPKRKEILEEIKEKALRYGKVIVYFDYIGNTKTLMVGKMILNELRKEGFDGSVAYRENLVITKGDN